jgi:hypothetical protein
MDSNKLKSEMQVTFENFRLMLFWVAQKPRKAICAS